MDTEAFWTVPDAARHFRVSRAQIYTWMDEAGLPFIVLGPRTRRIKPADAIAWAESPETQALLASRGSDQRPNGSTQ